MSKRRSSSKNTGRMPRLLALLAGCGLALFLLGELVAFATSDRGRVFIWRHLHLGDHASIVRIVGRRVRAGLDAARVPASARDEQAEPGAAGGTPQWYVSLGPDGAPMQVNIAVTREVEKLGAQVTEASETTGPGGEMGVRMTIGAPGRPLHELLVTRPSRHRPAEGETREIRVAILLTGAGEDPEATRTILARHEPFAVAVLAIADDRARLAREARAGGHEIVLQVPMEPENYPRVNPGPGTLLVSMAPGRIARALHDDLHEAGDVVAVTNFMGSFATQDEPFMTAFYDELRRARLPFLELAHVPHAVCRSLAAKRGVAYDAPDAEFDLEAREPGADALEHAWAALLERAARRGQAVVALRATRTSAAWLERALDPARARGVTIVPLSSLLHRPSAS